MSFRRENLKLYTMDYTRLSTKTKELNAYETDQVMTWCGGCGNYGIHNALKRALVLENRAPKDVLHCFDVGCNGNGSDKIAHTTIHGLHGRVLPLAAGVKIANPELTVLASAGDGAVFSEGVNHLIHAIRNDYPMVFILHDNQNYALTTGQASATTPQGCRMNSAPEGVPHDTVAGLPLMLSQKPSFLAQTFSADPAHMTQIFQEALRHNGFACVQVLQACPTYNRCLTEGWYFDRVFDIKQKKDYDIHSLRDALDIVDSQEKFPIGILYKNPEKKNFFESLGREPRNQTKEVTYYDIDAFY